MRYDITIARPGTYIIATIIRGGSFYMTAVNNDNKEIIYREKLFLIDVLKEKEEK